MIDASAEGTDSSRALRIALVLPRDALFAWDAELVPMLRQRGHQVATRTAAPARPHGNLALLLSLEAILYGQARNGHATPDETPLDDEADCRILVGEGDTDETGVVLRVASGDSFGDAGAVHAILEGLPPQVTIVRRDGASGPWQVSQQALAAVEEPHRFALSYARWARRACDALVKAVDALAMGKVEVLPVSPPMRALPARPFAPATFAMRSIAGRVGARIERLLRRGDAWRIAWRRTGGDGVRETLRWPAAPYAVLPDDGNRYFADPFLFAHRGTTYCFCEEVPYATNRGLISVFELRPDGSATAPRPIIERSCHLSYPMVFARDGAIFMIAESGAARTVELWRAVRFPDRWECDTVLLTDLKASDATLWTENGRSWLFATLGGAGRSSWDGLGLFSAPALRGPWLAHDDNPVLIDASAARPAGEMFTREGALWRPVQDCAAGYGSALALARVDRLDDGGYAQSVQCRLPAPPAWRASGVHTLNACAGFEVIDLLSGPAATLAGA